MNKSKKQSNWQKFSNVLLRIARRSSSSNDVLFVDANGYDCRKGDVIYYVALSAGGVFKTGWEFAETIHKTMDVWQTLITLSLVKGLYKNKNKAEESCFDAYAGGQKEIDKAFLKGLGV